MFGNGEKIRQNLGRVEFVGQTVPHGNPCIPAQGFHNFLTEAPVFNAVVHPAQHPGGVGNGFLLSHLGTGGAEVGNGHSQIRRCYFKGAPGTGGVLLKQQHDVLSLVHPMEDAVFLLLLQVCCQIQQVLDFLGGKIQKLQKAFTFQCTTIHANCSFT